MLRITILNINFNKMFPCFLEVIIQKQNEQIIIFDEQSVLHSKQKNFQFASPIQRQLVLLSENKDLQQQVKFKLQVYMKTSTNKIRLASAPKKSSLISRFPKKQQLKFLNYPDKTAKLSYQISIFSVNKEQRQYNLKEKNSLLQNVKEKKSEKIENNVNFKSKTDQFLLKIQEQIKINQFQSDHNSLNQKYQQQKKNKENLSLENQRIKQILQQREKKYKKIQSQNNVFSNSFNMIFSKLLLQNKERLKVMQNFKKQLKKFQLCQKVDQISQNKQSSKIILFQHEKEFVQFGQKIDKIHQIFQNFQFLTLIQKNLMQKSIQKIILLKEILQTKEKQVSKAQKSSQFFKKELQEKQILFQKDLFLKNNLYKKIHQALQIKQKESEIFRNQIRKTENCIYQFKFQNDQLRESIKLLEEALSQVKIKKLHANNFQQIQKTDQLGAYQQENIQKLEVQNQFFKNQLQHLQNLIKKIKIICISYTNQKHLLQKQKIQQQQQKKDNQIKYLKRQVLQSNLTKKYQQIQNQKLKLQKDLSKSQNIFSTYKEKSQKILSKNEMYLKKLQSSLQQKQILLAYFKKQLTKIQLSIEENRQSSIKELKIHEQKYIRSSKVDDVLNKSINKIKEAILKIKKQLQTNQIKQQSNQKKGLKISQKLSNNKTSQIEQQYNLNFPSNVNVIRQQDRNTFNQNKVKQLLRVSKSLSEFKSLKKNK